MNKDSLPIRALAETGLHYRARVCVTDKSTIKRIIGTYRRAATARLQLRRVVDRHEAGATLFPRCRNVLQSHAGVVAIGSPIPSEVLSTARTREPPSASRCPDGASWEA